MIYGAGALAFLLSGGVPRSFVALVVHPIELASGNTVTLGYWSGHEDISLALGGVERTLQATRGGLRIEPGHYVKGTEIRSHRAEMFGLGPQSRDILRAYDFRLKPLEYWQLVFDQGMAYKGAGRAFKGFVDGTPLEIKQKAGQATLSIIGQSAARLGTRTSSLRKAHQSYLLRGGDTSMKDASLTDADEGIWTTG